MLSSNSVLQSARLKLTFERLQLDKGASANGVMQVLEISERERIMFCYFFISLLGSALSLSSSSHLPGSAQEDKLNLFRSSPDENSLRFLSFAAICDDVGSFEGCPFFQGLPLGPSLRRIEREESERERACAQSSKFVCCSLGALPKLVYKTAPRCFCGPLVSTPQRFAAETLGIRTTAPLLLVKTLQLVACEAPR